MHLSECLDLYSASNSLGDPKLRRCVSEWLFKSTTEFYGWDDRLHLDNLFGMLCWSYSLAGIAMFFVKPAWTNKSNFPYISFALILIFVQGPLSFMADYCNMTNDSPIHVIDRFMAVINLSVQTCKMCTLYHYARPGTFYLQLCAITFAIFSFMNSQDSQQAQDPEGFILWHNLWHCYPLLAIGIETFDIFYLGDYDCTKISNNQRTAEKNKEWTAQKLMIKIKSSLLHLGPTSFSVDEAVQEKKSK